MCFKIGENIRLNNVMILLHSENSLLGDLSMKVIVILLHIFEGSHSYLVIWLGMPCVETSLAESEQCRSDTLQNDNW